MSELRLVSDALTVPTAELWIKRIADEPAPLVFMDLSRCRHIDGNAGWRLGNAIRRASFPTGQLIVVVPWSGSGDNQWFLNYTRSGFGQSLARHAAQIYDVARTDVTSEVRKYYSAQQEYAASTFRGLYGIHGLQRLVSTEAYFSQKFDQWLRAMVDIKSSALNMHIRELSTLCWEAVTNIVDHSDRAPLGQGVDLTQSISLRWYKKNALKSESPGHAAWRTLVEARRDNSDLLGFLEVLAADNGVGIAARQAQTLDVYSQQIDVEISHVANALRAGSTIKLTTRDAEVRGDPGFGYTNIASTIGLLGGWGLLRTGRLAFECNGIEQNGGINGFMPVERAFGHMPGTAVQVTVPIHSSQMSLELDQ